MVVEVTKLDHQDLSLDHLELKGGDRCSGRPLQSDYCLRTKGAVGCVVTETKFRLSSLLVQTLFLYWCCNFFCVLDVTSQAS